MKKLKAIFSNYMTYHSLATLIGVSGFVIYMEIMKNQGRLLSNLHLINWIIYLGQASLIFLGILAIKELTRIIKQS